MKRRGNYFVQGILSSYTLQVRVGPGENINAQQTTLQPSITVHVQGKEADVHALSELTRALNKKVYMIMHQFHIFFTSQNPLICIELIQRCMSLLSLFKYHFFPNVISTFLVIHGAAVLRFQFYIVLD